MIPHPRLALIGLGKMGQTLRHLAPLRDGGFEQISLEHVARDRRVFADGALTAAGWLIGRHGIFTTADLLMDVGLPRSLCS